MSKMILYFILIAFHTILNSQIALCLFTTHDCTFGPQFDKNTCSWMINSKLTFDDQGNFFKFYFTFSNLLAMRLLADLIYKSIEMKLTENDFSIGRNLKKTLKYI